MRIYNNRRERGEFGDGVTVETRTLHRWQVVRSGGTLTVRGHNPDGSAMKITGILEVRMGQSGNVEAIDEGGVVAYLATP
jgi:hypothetical protein